MRVGSGTRHARLHRMNIDMLKNFAADGRFPYRELEADILELIEAYEAVNKRMDEVSAELVRVLLRENDHIAERERRDEMIATLNKLVADYRAIERTREQHVTQLTGNAGELDCTCHLDSNGTRKCAAHTSKE